jgi:hypothetical protein
LINIDAEKSLDVVSRQVVNEVRQAIFGVRIELPKVIFVVGGPGAGKVFQMI